MRRARALTIMFGLALTLTGACVGQEDEAGADPGADDAPEPAKTYAVKRKQNLAYVSSEVGRRKLDLYLPEGLDKAPVLLYIHGGAWITGDKRIYNKLGKRFAKAGIAAAVINYRRGNGARHPAAVEDAAAAFAWLRTNAAKYRLDPEAIILAGHSAGGHTAGLLILDERYLAAVGEKAEHVRAAIGLEGIYDLPKLVEVWPEYQSMFVGKTFGDEPGAWVQASPQYHKSAAKVPWLVIHSPEDELVDMAQSERFVARLRELGKAVTFAKDFDTDHFDTVLKIGASSKETVSETMLDFIRARLAAR